MSSDINQAGYNPHADGIFNSIKGVIKEWEDSQKLGEPMDHEEVADLIQSWITDYTSLRDEVARYNTSNSAYSNPCAD